MRETIKHVILGALCVVVGFILGRMHDPTKISDIMYKTDTIECVRLDTCKIIVPEYKYIRTVDTIIVNSDDGHSVSLPITQKHYAKDSVYDAWISGYEPHLDSISIYERTKTQIITNTTIRLIESNKWSYYSSIGFSNNGNENFATMGLTINSPKKWAFGVNVGIGNNGHLYYGINVGLKLK